MPWARLGRLQDNAHALDLEGAQALGGTLALGVEPGTSADFDTLSIRDTTPHGQ